MLEIDNWNHHLSRRHLIDRTINSWGHLKADDALGLFVKLREDRPIRGLSTYTIPRVMEQGGNNPPPVPYVALVTQRGKEFFLDPDFFSLAHGDLDNDSRAKIVSGGRNGQTRKIDWKGQTVYVKNGYLACEPYHFILMHLLEQEGVHIAPLLFSTQHIIATLEVKGKLLSKLEGERIYHEYIRKLETYSATLYEIREKYIKKKLWTEKMKTLDVDFDFQTTNLFIRDMDSKNPLDWFTFIDSIHWFW